jgi:hypothetical protein
MVRVMAVLAAWIAGTAIAVSVAWFGANVVLRNAGVGPGIPVIDAAVPAPSVAAAPPAPPPPAPPRPVQPRKPPRAGRSTPPSVSASASPASAPPHTPEPSPAPAPAAGVRDYILAGGRVTLDVSQGSVQLVTAVPDAGDSVQTWSGTDWLRVDFSSGPAVSSLIASWYEQQPSITVTN